MYIAHLYHNTKQSKRKSRTSYKFISLREFTILFVQGRWNWSRFFLLITDLGSTFISKEDLKGFEIIYSSTRQRFDEVNVVSQGLLTALNFNGHFTWSGWRDKLPITMYRRTMSPQTVS